MTNLQERPTTDLGEAMDLATAFATRDKSQQEGQGKPQEQKAELESQPDVSSSVPGTDTSSTGDQGDADPDTSPKNPDPLASLTMAELLVHPTLGKLVQSHVDTVAAKQLTGKTASIRRELEQSIRQEVSLDVARKHFESMDPADLAEELRTNEEARKMYAVVSTTPPPVPTTPEGAKVQEIAATLRRTVTRLAEAGLPDDIAKGLDPNNHLRTGGDPDELLDAWITKVDTAIIEHKVKVGTEKITKAEQESEAINNQADSIPSQGGPLMTPGRRAAALPDLLSGDANTHLADAFARTSVRRGK